MSVSSKMKYWQQIRQALTSDACRTFAIIFTALSAILLGTYFGYFVVVWIEWGAILGGALLTGAVFLFQPTSSRIQFFRVLMFVAGLALTGAGITDILNFPESNNDVAPGLMTGIVLGLVLARRNWGASLHISNQGVEKLFKLDGLFLSFTLPVLGTTLVILADYVFDEAKTIIEFASATGLSAVLVGQLYLIKRKGRAMSEESVWISFLFMLVLVLYLLIELGNQISMPIESFVTMFVFVYFVLVAWFQLYVRTSNATTEPVSFSIKLFKGMANVGAIAGFVFLSAIYTVSLVQLINNSCPTSLVANYEDYFKVKDQYFIRLMMRDVYYGHQMENVSMDEKDTPVDFMKKFSTDRWSFARTIEHQNEWEEGVSGDIGILPVFNDDKILIAYVDHVSPAATAGYERGDQITLTRDYEAGKTHVFINKSSGVKIANTVKGEKHPVDTVNHKIIKQNGVNIGYLWLMDFNKAAVGPVQDAFQDFKKQGVQEIILDLRYNGGGHADAKLASLIAGETNTGKVYYKFTHSDKYRDQDTTIYLEHDQFSIPTKRLFVLTTDNTCSASELIINGLRPYLPVITIGSTTCGKPYFMQPIAYAGYVYLSITGKSFNADGQSDYEHGIMPTCKIDESFSHSVGMPGDALLDAALYYQKNNTCPMNDS
jgi:C-terminal processing protease CtpA/Prc